MPMFWSQSGSEILAFSSKQLLHHFPLNLYAFPAQDEGRIRSHSDWH